MHTRNHLPTTQTLSKVCPNVELTRPLHSTHYIHMLDLPYGLPVLYIQCREVNPCHLRSF